MTSTIVMVIMLLLTVYTKLPDIFGPILKTVFGSANLPAVTELIPYINQFWNMFSDKMRDVVPELIENVLSQIIK